MSRTASDVAKPMSIGDYGVALELDRWPIRAFRDAVKHRLHN